MGACEVAEARSFDGHTSRTPGSVSRSDRPRVNHPQLRAGYFVSTPKSASEFFESWVPARLSEVLASGVQVNTRCKVAVNVGEDGWVLAATDGQVVVEPVHAEPSADLVFRVSISPPMFERFVLAELANLPAVPAAPPPSSPLLKLFNLDNESMALVQNVPGALELVIFDGEDASCRAILAPGSRAFEPVACTLKCSLADAQALRAGSAQPMELFFGGRLQLEGDPQVAMALAGLFL